MSYDFWQRDEIKTHVRDIDDLIEQKFKNVDDSKALKIVLKGASMITPSAYKIASDQDTKAEWKTCFEELETMLVQRLIRDQSFCPDEAPDDRGPKQCAFCMRNRMAFQAAPSPA